MSEAPPFQSEFQSELDAFRATVESWLDRNAPAAPPGVKLPDSFMEVGTPEQFAVLQAWQQAVYDAGYLGMAWAQEHGGQGRPLALQHIVTEEMAIRNLPFMVNIIGLMWAGPVIQKFGTEEQKRRYLPPMLRGDEIWCQGFSEPDNGSDLANVQTTALRDGAEYILHGTKIWTQAARTGEPFDEASDARRAEEVIKWAELRSTAAYASGRVVDDGIIDPRDTRAAVGMALSACHNNEVKGAEGYGVFRM